VPEQKYKGIIKVKALSWQRKKLGQVLLGHNLFQFSICTSSLRYLASLFDEQQKKVEMSRTSWLDILNGQACHTESRKGSLVALSMGIWLGVRVVLTKVSIFGLYATRSLVIDLKGIIPHWNDGLCDP
jgi:hypothetical protein